SGVDGFRWDEYTVETLRLAPVVPAPDLTQYQQRRAYFTTDPVVDLGDTDAFPDAGDVLVLVPGSVVKLPPVNDQRVRRWRILSGTEYAGGGSFTVTSDHALVSPTKQIEVPEGDAWDFTNPPGTGS